MVKIEISEEKYNKELLYLLKKSKLGITITELVDRSSISRTSVRIALAYLLGANRVAFRQIGMAKVYYIK